MTHGTHLGEFLRARRAGLDPDDVGLADGYGRRRVPGLRREEVAQRAAISTDYYTRLEQGRIRPSEAVLESVAQALLLNPDQTAYLAELADLPGPVAAPAPSHRAHRELAVLQALLDDLALTPAFVIGARTEIVAWNALGAEMVTDFAAIPPRERYYIRLLVTDPGMRSLYADWDEVTRIAVEQMRRLNATDPDDPELVRLVAELSELDPDFVRWWTSHEVAPRTAGAKLLRHPVVGDLHLTWAALTWNPDPDLQVITWTAAPGTPTRARLGRLRDLAASRQPRRT